MWESTVNMKTPFNICYGMYVGHPHWSWYRAVLQYVVHASASCITFIHEPELQELNAP